MKEAETDWTKAEGGESGEGTESGGEERKFLNKAERESEGREAESRNRKRRGRTKFSNKAEGKGEARKRFE